MLMNSSNDLRFYLRKLVLSHKCKIHVLSVPTLGIQNDNIYTLLPPLWVDPKDRPNKVALHN